MSSKKVVLELTKEEATYQRRVKSVELALKASGNRGVLSGTLVKVAAEIYTYISTK